ncbi:MAG: Hpt domain-containing protein [Rhodospirillales bacterium]|nr:Hpt domain-containing protein [Rhodospirillales bacterium]
MTEYPADDLMGEFLAEAMTQLDALQAMNPSLGSEPHTAAYMKALLELVHTTKGACGFLPLPRLETVATAFAVVVDDIDAGKIDPAPGVMMLAMGVLDRFRDLLDAVRKDGAEPAGDDAALIRGLNNIGSPSVDQPAAPEPAPQAEPEPEPKAGAAFALYRLGDTLKAIDLVHVEWLDLIESLVADESAGGIVVASLDEAVQLAPHDEVAARNPSGPWPLMVLGKEGRRIGLIVDEVIDIVETPGADVEIVVPDTLLAVSSV